MGCQSSKQKAIFSDTPPPNGSTDADTVSKRARMRAEKADQKAYKKAQRAARKEQQAFERALPSPPVVDAPPWVTSQKAVFVVDRDIPGEGGYLRHPDGTFVGDGPPLPTYRAS